MCQSKLFLCAFTIVINSKTGVLILWYSHVVQALGNVGIGLKISLMQGTIVQLWDYLIGVFVLTVVCAGSLYTGNEVEKCLIFMLLSHWSLQCLYESGLV